MTVLVDTSVWIEYLRGTDSAHDRWIRRAITSDEPLGWTDPVLFELMAGARSNERALQLRSLLMRGPFLAMHGLADWETGATMYRQARSQGLTVRSSIDCLIAAVALRNSCPILARDRDFETLELVADIELASPG